MSYYVIIREKKDNDTPSLSEVVRNGYLSTVNSSWKNALFQEITFELIVLISAILFICFGIPLHYCISSVPIVLLSIYVLIYFSLLMKVAQMLYEKPALKCWVAEAYEPYFFMKNPENCWYKIIEERDVEKEAVKMEGFHRRIIGTVAVMQHSQNEDWAWLFRLVVDKRYRRKGIGLKLVNTVKDWCRQNQFNNVELTISECQEGCRELFNDAGYFGYNKYKRSIYLLLSTHGYCHFI